MFLWIYFCMLVYPMYNIMSFGLILISLAPLRFLLSLDHLVQMWVADVSVLGYRVHVQKPFLFSFGMVQSELIVNASKFPFFVPFPLLCW